MEYIKNPMMIEEKSFIMIQEIIDEIRPGYKFKNEIEEKLQDISDHHVIHTAKTMMYIEIRLLHMAMKLKNIADIRQSIYMMLETTEKTKDKEDIDYVINQLKELKTRYGYTLFDDAFTRKLKIKLGRIGTFSDSALLFLQDLEV